MYRYKMLSILIACLCLLTLSCADSPKSAATKQMPVVVKKQPLKICLYRYHNFSISKAMYLKEELQRVYPAIELMPEPIQLPKQYYSKTPSFCPQCKAFLNRKGWKLK